MHLKQTYHSTTSIRSTVSVSTILYTSTCSSRVADFRAVDWTALGSTIPAMLALTFFGVLHVPINVPALGLSLGEDNVDIDRELRAHGWSNALSGFCGSIQVIFQLAFFRFDLRAHFATELSCLHQYRALRWKWWKQPCCRRYARLSYVRYSCNWSCNNRLHPYHGCGRTHLLPWVFLDGRRLGRPFA